MDQARIDLNLLLVFDAVAREGNVTRAGRRLGLSQPAVSAALARLRDLLSDPLFVRTTAGMTPTKRARELIDPVEQALGLIRDSLQSQSLFDPRSSNRAFNVLMVDVGEAAFLPPIIQQLRTLGSDVCINAVQPANDRADQIAQLESGTVDLALGHWPRFSLRQGFYKERLFVESFVCVVGTDNALVGRAITLKQFAKLSHIVVATSGNSDGTIERALSKLGIVRKVALRVPHFLAIPHIVEDSDLIATIPLDIARTIVDRRRLRILPLPFHVSHFEVSQYWHKRFHHEPGLEWLRSTVQLALSVRKAKGRMGNQR